MKGVFPACNVSVGSPERAHLFIAQVIIIHLLSGIFSIQNR